MNETERDVYRSLWSPVEYLKQYYSSTHIPEDEVANFRFAMNCLEGRERRFHRAIEVGCGPTLHHALILAPYADEIHLADYLSSNLSECRRSLDGDAQAHDWRPYAQGLFGDRGDAAWKLLRERVSRLSEIDIRKPQVPGYDLVASYYCAEAVASDREQWKQCISGLSDLVLPGGVLLLSTMRHCVEYQVLGRGFPTCCVDERDLLEQLLVFGFERDSMIIEAVPIKEWADQGFDSICCVWATKRPIE